MIQLAEHLVEQVPHRWRVAVTVGAPPQVVLAGRAFLRHRGEGPDLSGGGQAVVIDAPMSDRDRLTGGPGDRTRSGISLQRSVVGESCAVVTDLGENPSAGEIGESCRLRIEGQPSPTPNASPVCPPGKWRYSRAGRVAPLLIVCVLVVTISGFDRGARRCCPLPCWPDPRGRADDRRRRAR